MIQAYTDGVLAYDSRIDDYALLGLKTTTGLNKGGSAEIIMQPGHPAYNRFVSLRTVVEIYLDGALNFRGRALYPSDDFYNRRTITCEGELCFLRDGIMRPYVYQDGPSAIFKDVINLYNSQVEEFKRFVIGTVTVTDANNYIRLESESPEQTLDTVNKLLERVYRFYHQRGREASYKLVRSSQLQEQPGDRVRREPARLRPVGRQRRLCKRPRPLRCEGRGNRRAAYYRQRQQWPGLHPGL